MATNSHVSSRKPQTTSASVIRFDSLISPDSSDSSSELTVNLQKAKEDTINPLLFSRSYAIRRAFVFMKREFNLCVAHLAVSIVLFLLLSFFLGLESSWRNVNFQLTHPLPPPLPSPGPELNAISNKALRNHLHTHFIIPYRYLDIIQPLQQRNLLRQLNGHHHQFNRYSKPILIFAHIHNCRVHQCIRAIASVMSYAQVTERFALLFVDKIRSIPLTHFLNASVHGLINSRTMLVSTDPVQAAALSRKHVVLNDWAELSVVHVERPTEKHDSTVQGSDGKSSIPRDQHPMKHEASDQTSFLSSTDIPVTLDNLVTVDNHVFISLSEVIWSRYAPRAIQEALFETTLLPVRPFSKSIISSASLLGRYSATRNIASTDRRLHEVFHVPKLLVRGMTPFARKLLLLKLQAKLRRGIQKPRALFVHTQYGLGNRLRALGSAMAFARRTHRVLVLIWVPDQHLNCTYTDLFVNSDEFVVADSFLPGEQWPFFDNNKTDPAVKSVKWYNYMRVNGLKGLPPKHPLLDEKDFHLYVSTCYVIQSPVTPFIIRTTSLYWHVLRSLPPNLAVLRLVDRFASYPISQMIGIHIRGKMIKTDISGISATEYSKESSRTTDYWRNLTQVDTFIEEMRRQAADQLFYVAADQKEVFARLEREFPSRVFYTPRNCDSRDRDCLPYALADILLLAKCESLRGSYWSSFSELSTRIGGARFLLAGVDFGRP